jgi:phage host-nuclease inhibitor protein Gam
MTSKLNELQSLLDVTMEALRKELKQKDDTIEEQAKQIAKLNVDVDMLTKRVEDYHLENFKYQEKVIELIDDGEEEK